MNNTEILLDQLRRDFATAAKIAGLAQPPAECLVVVDRYGEDMVSESATPTISDSAAHDFSVRLCKWLDHKSESMAGLSVRDAVAAMTAETNDFALEKIRVFESIEDAAQWYAAPTNEKYDSFVSYFITSGMPIYGFSIARDEA